MDLAMCVRIEPSRRDTGGELLHHIVPHRRKRLVHHAIEMYGAPGVPQGSIYRGDRVHRVLGRGRTPKTNVSTNKSSKNIDLTNAGKTWRWLGIYELKGDRLKICFDISNKGVRSTKFVSEPGSPNDVLLALERAD